MSQELGASGITKDTAQMMAPSGFQVITGTDTVTGNWYAIQALGGDVVFNAVQGGAGAAGLNGKTLSDGGVIFNALGFTSIDLTSGTLIAYHR